MEDDSIHHNTTKGKGTARVEGRSLQRISSLTRYFLLIVIAAALITLTVSAEAVPEGSALQNATVPQFVLVGVDVVDFKNFDVADGTVDTNFYLNLKSDSPVSINDLEIINGRIISVDTLRNTTHEKAYRVFAGMTADPDLRHFPFDVHTLPIEIESKFEGIDKILLVIDKNMTGLESKADIPGWEFTNTSAYITNQSYNPGEPPYSRAVFTYGITRSTASTIMKFFLPIMLIIIVSLSSLMMKISSRLGLNASMFLAAVLIHWRIADAIPLVAYATFLDIFMIITYATLVMVLVSGILILKFSEDKDTARIEQINYWSLRVIPLISISLYLLLFFSLFL